MIQQEQDITDQLIHQVKHPATLDVQFGEVAQIMERLRQGEQLDSGVKEEEEDKLKHSEDVIECEK